MVPEPSGAPVSLTNGNYAAYYSTDGVNFTYLIGPTTANVAGHKAEIGVCAIVEGTSGGGTSQTVADYMSIERWLDTPLISNRGPYDGETGVDLQPTCSFDLTADGVSAVDASKTQVWINGVLVWTADAVAGGWSGSKSVIAGGFHYELTAPGLFPLATVIPYRIYGENALGNGIDETTYFTTLPPVVISTAVGISDVTPVAKDLIKVQFSGDIAATAQVLDPNSYELSPIIGVAEVLPVEGDVTNAVVLRISPKAVASTTYTLTIPSAGIVTPLPSADIPPETFYTPAQVPLQTMDGSWMHHRTKVDAALANLPPLYSKAVGGTARAIVQAIGMSDEEIGGDF